MTRRVAFLLPHFRSGGAEKVVLHWIGALDRNRYTPMLFLNRVEGDFLNSLPDDIRPVSLGGGRAMRLPGRIGRALADHDIAIAYSATNAMNLALLAAPRGNTARIVSEHTPPAAYLAEAKLPRLRRTAMRWLYPRADAVAVPTQRIADELASVIAPNLRTVVLPNPVVDAVVETIPDRPPRDAIAIIAAGRLVVAKGYDTLIAAAALLAARGVAFHLTIHGDGPLRPALAAQIAAAGLDRHVTLAGHSDRLGDAIAAADLFVLASRREGFGNVVVEAMAVGTPVIATRGGGPETLIRDGDNGWLVAPDDPSALADAIARAAGDRAARAQVASTALATAQCFGIAASTTQFTALLDRVGPPGPDAVKSKVTARVHSVNGASTI